MLRQTRLAAALLVLSPALLAASCGPDSAAPSAQEIRDTSPRADGPATIRVPADHATISAAVAEAREGDLVLISPGRYRETVKVTVPGITLRGTSRAGVVVDGELLRSDGVVVTAPGVSVQNLTVRDQLQNGLLVTGMVSADGVYSHAHSHGETETDGEVAAETGGTYERLDPKRFPPLQRFRVDHVTAINNGLYGIYAFDAQHGVIEDSYASGSADSGIYVGQCQPCDTVVRRNVMERNAVGFEDANAGGDLYVVDNRMTGNRIGATMNSDHQEAFVPQRGVVFAGNLVADNQERATPAQADGGFGVGLGIAGGTENRVFRNRIEGNRVAGVLLTSNDDLPPLDNHIESNLLAGNGTDLVYAPSGRAPGSGNCLVGNTLRTVVPAAFARGAGACPPGSEAVAGAAVPAFGAPAGVAFSEVAEPPAQPELPRAATLGPVGELGDPPAIDLAKVTVP